MASFTIALTSDALFSLVEGNAVYPTGAAFPFVKALTKVNEKLSKLDQAIEERFKIVLITNNLDMDRLNKSIQNHNLNIDQIYEITAKKCLSEHLNDLKPVLYLSTDSKNVKEAINAGYGAATMSQGDYDEPSDDMLRVAFDGDGILFSDESEKVFKQDGLEAFLQNEERLENEALQIGPLSEFAKALLVMQKKFPKSCPIRTYLVTSRGTGSCGIRSLMSLRKRGLGINEALLLDGSHKGQILKAIKPHIFFDDQQKHVNGALENRVVGAHVPFGELNN
ncbi:cytosolic 5'-nucleotidase 1A-like [Paramisgurnus dabryanus]|uniref:cytosolic 5'-nucleotidase 1A-like n=1 Tax=Paramisgurnus dabryanus TaxID=90735 RepID=UPI0031F45E32